ncbi:hypothetical protein K443DRAFT_682374 [Laccaria amethystina LaAM-08-1]|uniref:Ricin B lectin domain-containing protein n=1 Tax=Laccaria amethystina LaAM-08-1 TaxID=1095629 RepID=A0A0C9WKH2_9AGAR|nr:hypothetical protein K443DRAFT_682374 [Laccaria amethystina LaAM-08-1]
MTTASTTLTQLPPGIYRIVVVGPGDHFLTYRLTDEGGRVTLRPPGAGDDLKQLWRIDHGKDGNSIIGRPSNKWPSPFLAYKGDLKEGSLIDVIVFDFPKNEWYLKLLAGFKSKILVADSDLGIKISPLINPTEPPLITLELSAKDQVEWVFEFVGGK